MGANQTYICRMVTFTESDHVAISDVVHSLLISPACVPAILCAFSVYSSKKYIGKSNKQYLTLCVCKHKHF